MDGLLVIDKPSGPTSHDIVATARRVLGERRIGHTGTLDPLASGVLPLVVGRATRLARFLSGSDKDYEATIGLGFGTDTGDCLGQPVGPRYEGPWPLVEAIEHALERFRGTYLQQPPAFSAKKIEGRRSYRLARSHARTGNARADALATPLTRSDATVVEPSETSPAAGSPIAPAPVQVTVRMLELLGVDGPLFTVRVSCSAGFYVRALAAELGVALGTGGHLTALRRTRVGSLTLDDAVPLQRLIEAGRSGEAAFLRPLAQMLTELPGVALTEAGVRRVAHGQDVGPADMLDALAAVGACAEGATRSIRLLDAHGALIAIADAGKAAGSLHPAVVLM